MPLEMALANQLQVLDQVDGPLKIKGISLPLRRKKHVSGNDSAYNTDEEVSGQKNK